MESRNGSAAVPQTEQFDQSAPAAPFRAAMQESSWTVFSGDAVRGRPRLASAGPVALTETAAPVTAAAEAGGDRLFSRLLHKMSGSFAQAIGQQAARILTGARPEVREAEGPPNALPVEIEADAPVRPSRRFVRIDEQWRIESVTAEAAHWIGAPELALIGLDVREAMSLPRAVADAVSFSLTTGRSAAVQTPAPGRLGRWMDFHVEPLGGAVKLRFWDVTEASLRQLREQADADAGRADLPLADAGSTELALLDENGVIVSVNEAWRTVFANRTVQGHAAGVGAPYLDLCRQVIVGFDEEPLSAGLKALASGESPGFTRAYRIRTAGRLRWREVRITPMRIAGATQLLAIHTDLTEVARVQAAWRSSEERVIRAQQEERQRIAIELHDSTGQHLIALGLGITRLRRLIRAEDARAVLEEMSFSVKEAVKEVRVLSYLMRPTGVDEEGLEAAARGFVTGFGARTGLNVSFRAEGLVDRVGPAVRHAVFRIIQEALANVHRHAGAKGVEVELSRRSGVLSVRIADDGRGIPALRSGKLAPSEIGVGVASMQERVAKLGGLFDITSDAAGAVVTASFPDETGSRPPV
jgi:signal transduction histidine kinase